MKKTIKTRFAPSPTGYLHIGGLRTALYNYLFARQNKDKFLIRIEDTDQKRYVPKSEIQLLETLQKIGLDWDEGPFIDKSTNIKEKGENSPYFQSKRLKIYQKYIDLLIKNNQSYYCFCSEKRLIELKNEQILAKKSPKYDGLCRKLTEKEKNLKLKNRDPYTIRLKVPVNQEISFNDLIRGKIKINSNEIDDQVLIKSDGFPTYHFAVVVDDHLMGISHIIRGEEWLPSTPKHVLLYQFFGWPLPIYAHLPLLLNSDRSKLSKRQGDVSVEDYLDKGYLPEALINYVALMGWHPQDNRELFNLTELVVNFDLTKVQKAGAVFDLKKLNWFNNHYLRQKSPDELYQLASKFLPMADKETVIKFLSIEKERLEKISDAAALFKSIIEPDDYRPELLIFSKSTKEKTLKGLNLAMEIINKIKKIEIGSLKNELSKLSKENNLTNGDLFWPVRVALSGQEKSPPPEELIYLLGAEEAVKRISTAIDKLSSH